MENKRFRVGSIAVLFAVVVLCVAIFGTLTVSTAVSDQRTAQRYGAYVRRMTQCQNMGQQWLAQADAYLAGEGPMPEQSEETDTELGTTLTENGVELVIRLKKTGNGYEIAEWSCRAQWQPEAEWSLWQEE